MHSCACADIRPSSFDSYVYLLCIYFSFLLNRSDNSINTSTTLAPAATIQPGLYALTPVVGTVLTPSAKVNTTGKFHGRSQSQQLTFPTIRVPANVVCPPAPIYVNEPRPVDSSNIVHTGRPQYYYPYAPLPYASTNYAYLSGLYAQKTGLIPASPATAAPTSTRRLQSAPAKRTGASTGRTGKVSARAATLTQPLVTSQQTSISFPVPPLDYQLPGYGGHVRSYQFRFGKSFGRCTADCLKEYPNTPRNLALTI